MRILLDLDRLLAEGEITAAEHEKLARLAARDTTTLAVNILGGFGVIAVSGGALALLPTPTTAIVLGLLLATGGIALVSDGLKPWQVLARIFVVVGTLLFGGGVIVAGHGSIGSVLLVAVAAAGASVMARSVLLAVLAVLALASCVGARTGYLHASYFFGIEEPGWTVVLFTGLAVVLHRLSARLPVGSRPLAMGAASAAVFLVNFGFWIGSLWGHRSATGAVLIPDWVFAGLWAVALLAAGVWARRRNRRWLINVSAVFAAIHFYTQWFERLGDSPGSVLIGGLLALGFALGLRSLNSRGMERPAVSSTMDH